MAVTQSPVFEALARIRVLPVVILPRIELAVPLARLLIEEGLPVIEITCRSVAAIPAMRLLRDSFSDLLVGAGTVLSVTQLGQAVQAGAQFMLAPGYDPEIVAASQAASVPMLPGVLSPTEVAAASAAGLEVVKLFPASTLGGAGYLRTLRSVYPAMRFVPTGGITQANLMEFLAEPNVICCGGTWLAPAELLQNQRWDDIRTLVRAAVSSARSL
jgi:2-dehydro-3-deoxyphosphogluconate aldolase / (4S)-4-hydroxy-2-oxoglutarate aldolase